MSRQQSPRSRRSFLATTAGLTTSVTTGCLGTVTPSSAVSVLAAGSLQNALTLAFPSLTDVRVEVEVHGSVHAARMVAENQRDPDVLALADPSLFSAPLDSNWYATFANNAIVLAYNPKTAGGRRVETVEPWVSALLDPAVTLGRTDPDLDPLGYRTLFALELAADYYDSPGLADRLLGRNQTYPETQLLAQFDAGSIDAAFVYRSMAVERDYPYVELPDAVNMSEPRHVDSYASTSYTLPDDTVVRGGLIEYAATRRTQSRDVVDVFHALVESAARYLEPRGFTVRESLPTYTGDVPTTA